MNIKAVAFDAYGTLFDVLSVTALCEQLFPGHGGALAQLWRAKQLKYSLLRSLMDRYEDFWRLTEDGLRFASTALNLKMTAAKQERLMDSYLHLTLFPDVASGLNALKRLGLRLAILSNGEPNMLEVATRNAGIENVFDAIISAHEVRVFKPSPVVYRLVSQRLMVGSNQLAFVSSNSWDINGAASAGLTTCWIHRSGDDPPEELGFSPDHVVKTVTQLADVLRPRSV